MFDYSQRKFTKEWYDNYDKIDWKPRMRKVDKFLIAIFLCIFITFTWLFGSTLIRKQYQSIFPVIGQSR